MVRNNKRRIKIRNKPKNKRRNEIRMPSHIPSITDLIRGRPKISFEHIQSSYDEDYDPESKFFRIKNVCDNCGAEFCNTCNSFH